MTWSLSVVREFPSEREKILPNGRKPVSSIDSVADEMQVRVRRLAFPGEPGESIKAVLGRVARRSGVTFNEAKRLWYREWRRVPADIADKIREAQRKHERTLARQLEELRESYKALYGEEDYQTHIAPHSAPSNPALDEAS